MPQDLRRTLLTNATAWVNHPRSLGSSFLSKAPWDPNERGAVPYIHIAEIICCYLFAEDGFPRLPRTTTAAIWFDHSFVEQWHGYILSSLQAHQESVQVKIRGQPGVRLVDSSIGE